VIVTGLLLASPHHAVVDARGAHPIAGHPIIAAINAIDRGDIVMELVEGQDLRRPKFSN
jgi:hypothetical protein